MDTLQIKKIMNSRVPIFDHQLVKSAPAVLGDVPTPSDDLAQVYPVNAQFRSQPIGADGGAFLQKTPKMNGEGARVHGRNLRRFDYIL